MSQVLFRALNDLIQTSKTAEFEVILGENIEECLKLLNLSFLEISESPLLTNLDFIVSDTDTPQWKFIGTISHILLSLLEVIQNEKDYSLSVNSQKNIKSSLQFVISMGVLPNLIPGVGIPMDRRSEFAKHYKRENIQILEKYHRLTAMCNLLTELCNVSDVKTIIYTHFLGDYLALLFQLSYAPIMKPETISKSKKSLEFVMNEELYNQLLLDQSTYKKILDPVISKTYRPMLMKELILLQGGKDPEPPLFMKKVLSKELSTILLSEDGMLCTLRCFFDDDNIDIGNQWKQIDIVKRLISVKHGSISIEDYLKNICNQIKKIIQLCKKKDYVIVSAACVSNLLEKYPNNEFVLDVVNYIISPFSFEENDSIIGPLLLSSEEVCKFIKILDLCFNTPKLSLPSQFLTPIIHTIFSLRVCCPSVPLRFEINNIIIKYLQSKHLPSKKVFDSLLFMEKNEDIVINRNISYESKNEGVQINYGIDSYNISVESAITCILEMIEENSEKTDLAISFYVYCLHKLIIVSNRKDDTGSKEFLIHEDDSYNLISKNSENTLILLKALEKLSAKDCILDSFKENPNLIVSFVTQFLNNYVTCLNSKNNFINNDCVVICLTLITVLLAHCSESSDMLKLTLKPVESSLKIIISKTSDKAIIFLCEEINKIMMQSDNKGASKNNSDFEKALSEICDPLLPVRAHGLMHLTKLIEQKDAETISKKYYVQCIFEQNLKNDDSYIYLTSINGLAAMACLSAEEVLDVLTREFLNDKSDLKDLTIDKDENIQIRMKIGEVLVKVTKSLGEVAPNHKTLLLNTFLVGCKDSDDLLRASSLSNLAEACRVLSYKLGPVLYELLNLIDSILQTDKSVECRRASVLVVSSLLKGLGKEALYFLREALLPIYRTLKSLYNNEAEDDKIRLHAQIGLEELNSIVRGILFAPVKMEKQIFIPDKPNFL